MKRLCFICFIIFALCITWLPQQSRAICEECPFPLARIFGKWQSPNRTFLARIIEVNRGNQQSMVAISIYRNDTKRLIAAGRVIAAWGAPEVMLTLHQSDGSSQSYRLSLNETTDELTLDGVDDEVVGGRCNIRSECFNLRRLPRRSTRFLAATPANQQGFDPTTIQWEPGQDFEF